MNRTIFKIALCCVSVFVLLLFINYRVRPRHHSDAVGGTREKGLTMERTFALIKPDAVAAQKSGFIISIIEWNKFNIVKMQKMHLTKQQAEQFYGVHKAKPFFAELVAHITSGPLIALALEKENAIKEWRELMGATDCAKAAPGTLRRMFAESITRNAVHGSDAPETAQSELKFFFPEL